MNLNKFFQYIVILITLVLISSCGDLFMKKKGKSASLEQFERCDLNTKALSDIMVKNIQKDLECLGENLDFFINIVKTDRPGNLSLKELKFYINKHISDVDPELVQSLDTIFEINSVLLGDHKYYIARKNVQKLTYLLIEFNEVMVENEVVTFFKDTSTLNLREYKYRRMKVYEAVSYVAKVLESIPTPNKNTARINILNTIGTFKKEFDEDTFSKISKILFLKRVFLGGSENFLNGVEAKRMVHNLSDLVTISYDVTHLNKVSGLLENELELISIVTNLVASLDRSLFSEFNEDEIIFYFNDLKELLETFFPSSIKYLKYRPELLKIKKILLGSDKEGFSMHELKEFSSNLLLKNLQKGSFFYKTYSFNSSLLDQGQTLDFNLNALYLNNNSDHKFLGEFNRIVKSYRFIKGLDAAPVYQKFVKRDPLGIFTVSLFEQVVEKVIKIYGETGSNSRGGYHLTSIQIKSLMKNFEDLLVAEDLLHPGRLLKTSETVSLMSGIFQSNSNGDKYIERDELVQFVSTILTSIEIKKAIYKNIPKYCELDEKGRFSSSCFRRSFYKILEQTNIQNTSLASYFPKLMDFLDGLSQDRQIEYAKTLEEFSRNCTEYNGNPIKMGPGDIFQVFGGVQSVEQTMIRFDDDENNLLERVEVDKAFNIYKDSIIKMIPDPNYNSYSKTIFLYLIRYKEIPTVGGTLVQFISNSQKYTAVDRFTLASIIKLLSSKSKAPPFPCHTLLD